MILEVIKLELFPPLGDHLDLVVDIVDLLLGRGLLARAGPSGSCQAAGQKLGGLRRATVHGEGGVLVSQPEPPRWIIHLGVLLTPCKC